MEFHFYFSTAQPLIKLKERLTGMQVIHSWEQKINRFGVFDHIGASNGMRVKAFDILSANSFRNRFQRHLAFDPSHKLHFIVDEFQYEKDGNYTGVMSMLRACSCLLEAIPGEAVLLSHENDILLKRRGHQITLNSQSGFWNPYRISKLDLPFHLQPLIPLAA